MCSGRRYGSIDMQHDLFGSVHDLDLRSNYISFDASRQEKHDADKINVVSLLSQKLLQKNVFFAKKLLFLEFLLSGGQTVDLRLNLRTWLRKNVIRAIECAFLRRCSSAGSRVMCRFVEKCWNRQNLTFGDLWWHDLWPDLKNEKAVPSWFVTFFRMPLTACWYMAHEPS